MPVKDITRFLHQPRKHYQGARVQQGRALLDSDYNEGARLAEDDQRRTLLGMLGSSASPDEGFSLGTQLPASRPLQLGDVLPVRQVVLGGVPVNVHGVSIRPGSIYAGGMRFELGAAEDIAFQRDFLQMSRNDLPLFDRAASPSPYSPRSPRSPQYPPFRDFYYLHAWEQPVSSAEDEEFLERGLGGPDTTLRMRRMRRVEILPLPGFVDNCREAWEEAIRQRVEINGVLDRNTGELVSNGLLSLGFEPSPEGDCPPCTPDPPSQYLGSENHALRIMLTSPRTFVWAFDNGAPLYRVKITGLSGGSTTGVEVTMLTPPRDEEHQPSPYRVIEILPFSALLEGGEGDRPTDPHFGKLAAEVGVFTRVLGDYNPVTGTFKIDTSVNLGALQALIHEWDPSHPAAAQLNIKEPGKDSRFFYMRMWHVADKASDVERFITSSPNQAPLGTTGIVPRLMRQGRRGDYWVATLRTDTPERVVPLDLLTQPGGVPPHGPRHFYAPLAFLEGNNLRVRTIEDCRTRMRRMTDRGCATFTVGDGISSVGDFRSIDEAINSLPVDGGVVTVGAGIYRETIRVKSRRNVSVVGCGDSAIIQSPAGATTALVSIEGSTSVTFSDFRVNVAEHTGIAVTGSSRVNVRRLLMVAGTLADDAFQENAGTTDDPLVSAKQTSFLVLAELAMLTQRRPAVSVVESSDVRASAIRCEGVSASAAPPAAPLIGFSLSERVLARDCELTTFGQVGVFLASSVRQAELVGLSIFAGPHHDEALDVVLQAQSTVDIDGSERVLLARSRLLQADANTEHAAVVAQGRQIVIEGNTIDAGGDSENEAGSTLSAWGGVHVRGGSEDVVVRDNQITGGLGHGITLGSAIWIDLVTGTTRREGAGFSQVAFLEPETEEDPVVTGSLSPVSIDEIEYTPLLEGELSEIRLSRNRIRGFATNGISVLTVLGAGEELISVRRSVIEGNTIVGNVLRPSPDVVIRNDVMPSLSNPPSDPLPLPALPFGGIVLAEASAGGDIRDNVVAGNGSSASLPQSGIFVLAGDSLVISGNRVIDNGARALPDSPASADVPPKEGPRAGIVVMLAGIAPVVEVFELNATLDDAIPLDSAGLALQVTGNSVRQPEGRALQAVAVGPAMIDGNFFASLGNHGADEEGEVGALGETIFLMSLGRPWESFGAETLAPVSPDDEFDKYITPSRTRDYLTGLGVTNPHSPPRFVGLGGQITFNNNQVTLDWKVVRFPGELDNPLVPIAYFPVTLLTLDHLTLSSNQFALRLSFPTISSSEDLQEFLWSPAHPELFIGHVLAGGATASVVRNRFSENLGIPARHRGTVTLSLFSGAELMNLTAFNQSTHVVEPYKWSPAVSDDPFTIDIDNQVLFPTNTGDVTPIADRVRELFEILWQP